MLREHLLHRLLELLRFPFEVLTQTAAGLRCVARQLHPVDGEDLLADEALTLADDQHLGEQRLDGLAMPTHEAGDGGEVRVTVAAQGTAHAGGAPSQSPVR
jgi:hypothetical protein